MISTVPWCLGSCRMRAHKVLSTTNINVNYIAIIYFLKCWLWLTFIQFLYCYIEVRGGMIRSTVVHYAALWGPTRWTMPRNMNKWSVKLTQGELMLCPSCDAFRFPANSMTMKLVGPKKASSKDSNVLTIPSTACSATKPTVNLANVWSTSLQ